MNKEDLIRLKPDEFARLVVAKVLTVAQQNEPEQFMGWFMGAIVTNVFGNLPESIWQRLMECRPCGRVGCDCHMLAREVMPTLDKLRQDQLQHCPPSPHAE